MARKPPQFDHHPQPFPSPATFRAVCLFVYDGDTHDYLIDLGFGQYAYVTVRLRGIDAPEVTGVERPQGVIWTEYVRDLLLAKPVMLRTYRDPETFGRYVADVEFWQDEGPMLDLVTHLRDMSATGQLPLP